APHAPRSGRAAVGLLRPAAPTRPGAATPPVPQARGALVPHPRGGRDRVPVRPADALPRPGEDRARGRGRRPTVAGGVPGELRGVPGGTAPQGPRPANRLPLAANGRIGRSGAGSVPRQAEGVIVSRELRLHVPEARPTVAR